MGFRWYDQSKYCRKGILPKVALVGSIDATCSGHQLIIDFVRDRIVLRFPDYDSVSVLRKSPLPYTDGLARALRFSDQQVFAKVGKFKELELFPQPSLIVRLLSPRLRRLAKAGY